MARHFFSETEESQSDKIGMEGTNASRHQRMVHIAVRSTVMLVHESRLGSGVEFGMKGTCCEMRYYIRYGGVRHELCDFLQTVAVHCSTNA